MAAPQVIAQASQSALEVEEPDLVIYRLRGVIDGPDVRALRQAEGRWNVGKPYLLVMIDLSKQLTSTQDARRASTEAAIGTAIRALAFFGGSRHVRILTDLVMRARRLLVPGGDLMRFLDDEATARRWLVEQRAELAAQVRMH